MERNLDSPQGAQRGMGCWVNSYRVSPMQEPLLSILNPSLKVLILSITEVQNRIFTIAEDYYWVLSQFSPFRVNYSNSCSPFHINFVFWTSDPVQCSSLNASQTASDFLEMQSPNVVLHQGCLPAEESRRIVSCTSQAKWALRLVKEHSGGWGWSSHLLNHFQFQVCSPKDVLLFLDWHHLQT